MIFESYSVTNVGKVRKNNEDNYYVNGTYKESTETLEYSTYDTGVKDNNLYAVCDGMGGEEFGEKASMLAVSTLKHYQGVPFTNCLDGYIKSANKKICDLILSNGGVRSGTTFAALSIENNIARVFNVGDSRVYMIRQGGIKQISVDHTRLQQMLDMGVVADEVAKNSKDKHVLTQHLGIFPDEFIISPAVSGEIALAEGDMFILCSDGLTDMLTDGQILQTVLSSGDVRQCGTALVNAALANGGRDNVTVQVVRCVGEKKKAAATSINTTNIVIAVLTFAIVVSAFFIIKNHLENADTGGGTGVSSESDKDTDKENEKDGNEADGSDEKNVLDQIKEEIESAEEAEEKDDATAPKVSPPPTKAAPPKDIDAGKKAVEPSVSFTLPEIISKDYHSKNVKAIIESENKPKSLTIQVDDGKKETYDKISKNDEGDYEVKDIKIALDDGKKYKNGDSVEIKVTVQFEKDGNDEIDDYTFTKKLKIGDAD